MARKTRAVTEFGDFQTPLKLAEEIVALLARLKVRPKAVLEPTCGRGSFLVAASAHFPKAQLHGVDVNADYLEDARSKLPTSNARLEHASFFQYDWVSAMAELTAPVLVLGNPPWVTNSELGVLKSDNLPKKSNAQNLRGIEALTGKSNFDISEWMLLQNIEWLSARSGFLAVLCKTAVARKVLRVAWRGKAPISDARIYRIDALEHFGASVDACLLYAKFNKGPAETDCRVYASLSAKRRTSKFGMADNIVVADVEAYQKHASLRGPNADYVWRSGVKHDCSKVMELTQTTAGFVNGHGETVDIEKDCLFPLLKSSDLANPKKGAAPRYMIVPQRAVGEDTKSLRTKAPKTWSYLTKHGAALDKRSSVIYRNKPRFSIFGVGPYTFMPWKVAISGLYKKLSFRLIGPFDKKPIVLDDTAYFLAFETKATAERVHAALESDAATEFLSSMIFWDEKRPITVDLLKRLDIAKLAPDVEALPSAVVPRRRRRATRVADQLPLFAET